MRAELIVSNILKADSYRTYAKLTRNTYLRTIQALTTIGSVRLRERPYQ